MGRPKGSRSALPDLKTHNPEKFAELVLDIRDLGVNRVADETGVTNRFISGFINEKYGISEETLIKLRTAICTLRKRRDNAISGVLTT